MVSNSSERWIAVIPCLWENCCRVQRQQVLLSCTKLRLFHSTWDMMKRAQGLTGKAWSYAQGQQVYKSVRQRHLWSNSCHFQMLTLLFMIYLDPVFPWGHVAPHSKINITRHNAALSSSLRWTFIYCHLIHDLTTSTVNVTMHSWACRKARAVGQQGIKQGSTKITAD